MLDIGWAELFVIGILVLLVAGPRDLPKILYEFGKWVRRARAMAREFQGHVDGMMREVELEELRKEAQKLRRFDLREEIERSIDPRRSTPGRSDGASDGDRRAEASQSVRTGSGRAAWSEADLDGADQSAGADRPAAASTPAAQPDAKDTKKHD